ncbi:MAG TPA: flagellar basal body rod protein FlgC [Anaerolineaceae bacterium]|nr:flagellar basal body rod protein FlgC [Anaerolineaceae bacterium]
MSFWNSLRISASGLSAQRLRLDLISNNIANAQTTHTAEGGAYKRQDVVFMQDGSNGFVPASLSSSAVPGRGQNATGGVRVAQIVTDGSEGSTVYDPTHPDADENGYVTMPNVNLVVEMTNMLSATRSYEANLTVVEASKRMALKALDIAR